MTFKVSELDIIKFINRANFGYLPSVDGLIAQVIKDTTGLKGYLIGNKFYFSESRFTLENIDNSVIIKEEEIIRTKDITPFEFEVTPVDNIPW